MAVKEANIKEYRIVCGESVQSASSNNSWTINNATSNVITNYAEDSRGNIVSLILLRIL